MERAAAATAEPSGFGPQAQANMLWALSTLHFTPHPAWLRAFLQRSIVNLAGGSASSSGGSAGAGGASPQAMAATIGALAKMQPELLAAAAGSGGAAAGCEYGILPPRWAETFLTASMRPLARQAAAASAAEARALGAARLSARRARQDGGDAAALAAAAAAYDARAAAAAAASASGFNSQELSHILWAISGLSVRPGPSWLAAASASAAALMPLMPAGHVAVMLRAVARMPQLPGEERLLAAGARRLAELCAAAGLCDSGDGADGCGDGVHACQEHAAAAARLADGERRGVPALPPPTGHCAGAGTVVAPQDVANALWALASLGYQPEPRDLSALLHAGVALLPKCGHAELAQVAWATAQLAPVGSAAHPSALAPLVVRHSAPLLRGMSYVSLWTILAFVADAGYR
eukprot:131158-Chlamydomonas_euryale.AAC.6